MSKLPFLLLPFSLITPAAMAADGARLPASQLQGATPFIAVSVADLDRQLAWYTSTFGLAVYSRGELPGRGIKYALLRSDSALIELLQVPGSRPRALLAPSVSDAVQLHGFFKSGVVVPDVEAAFKALKAKGEKFAFELTRPPGGPYRVFGLHDAEGNLVQVFGN
ncbi:VOC family protein [Paucibacter sp. XJ19-41]|uniref:VOC family protein n=1 Tax=Paucibacter sp. XJ19-41 TaxID=2927824 RepID=UPI00234961DD|nr:VOC family protein [Paucibacter sp. XJ19-41]MDC6167446.1 VOC family protein [Paucibacter sp. XJ19-41]